MLLDIIQIIFGVAILIGGGELLVRGSCSLARLLGVSPMVIGLTVVALGTSAPELVVSSLAALRGNAAICGGNIVGSNILNILLVLSITALIAPLKAAAGFVRREVPITVLVSLLFWGFVLNGELAHWQARVLLVLMGGYLVFTVWIARREKADVTREYEEELESPGRRGLLLDSLFIVVGLAMLGGGSELFLRGSVHIAKTLGISEAMIGLTLVAVGTSLPELAACVIAALRKHADICLGNLIGSCIFNILAIGGVSGTLAVLPFEDEMVRLHVPVMVGAMFLFWFLVWKRLIVGRREGIILLVTYAGYLSWTIVTAKTY